MEITAQMVKALRDKTGIGFNKCREALTECGGDEEKAFDYLRKKGMETAAKKSGRDTRQGLVLVEVSGDNSFGAVLEVNCESDFVARNDEFLGFTGNLIQQLLNEKSLKNVKFDENDAGLEKFCAMPYSGDKANTVDATLKSMIAKIGENMRIRRLARFDLAGKTGYVGSYVHMGGKIGVLISMTCKNAATKSKPEFQEMVKDICMQVAASNPLWVSREQVPADIIAKEREIYSEQMKGKPANIVDKIVDGKLAKLLYAEKCLLEQLFIRDDSKQVLAMINEKAKALGDEIGVTDFARFELGAD